MKENSIEEDIELLQDETSSLGLFLKCKGSEKYKIAIEHILSDYKRVLKENEELKNQEATQRKINELLVQRYSSSIPVQKVKDKIKEEKMQLTIVGGIRNKKILEYGISLGRMQVLQELIEEREEK